MNRRSFLQGIAAGAVALVLPPTLDENAEAAKRFWALDSTMVRPASPFTCASIYVDAFFPVRVGDLLCVRHYVGGDEPGHFRVEAIRTGFDSPFVKVLVSRVRE